MGAKLPLWLWMEPKMHTSASAEAISMLLTRINTMIRPMLIKLEI